jgi:hypothetical protein
MRVVGAVLLLLLGACSTAAAPSGATPSPSPVAECRLPIVWSSAATLHHSFLSYPNGDITETAITSGDTYDTQYRRWLPGGRELVSPDGSQYAYWSPGTTPDTSQVHVVAVESGSDRIAYSGATNYWPIAFAGDGIYLMHAINLRQSAFEGLFRLDPAAGGTPARVRGSDLLPHAMWTLVSGGSAWGLTNRGGNQQILNAVEQLNLATGTVTDWVQESPDLNLSPVGLDAKGRLYITDNYQLRRLNSPNVEERLLSPPQVAGQVTFSGFVADAHGEWMGGYGGVWHFSDSADARKLAVPADQGMVLPAGPCL